MNFHEYSGPYTHAIAACRFEAEDPYLYFHWAYGIRSYYKTYHNPMILVSIEGLASDTNIYSPKLSKLRGRLKTKRIRKGTWDYQIRKYRNCRQVGHNTRHCIGLPIAKNRYRERVCDWNITKDNNSVGNVIVVDIGSRQTNYDFGQYSSH